MALQTRPATDEDLPFLAGMTALAAFPPGPLPDKAIEMPHARRWLDGWGRYADFGVIALEGDLPVGAAWCRMHAHAVARDADGKALPEVAIAVVSEARNRGIGARLLQALSEAAARAAANRH